MTDVRKSENPAKFRLIEYIGLREIPWNPAYVSFLIYFIVIMTYIASVAFAAMAIAVIAIAFGSRHVNWPLTVKLLIFFWLWAIIPTTLSTFPGDFEELLTLGKVVLVFIVAANVLENPHSLRFFLVLYVLCFALFPARGTIFNYFIYHAADFNRPAWRDSFGNPNDMAALTILSLAIAAGLLHKAAPRVIRLGALLSCLIFPFVILLTQSRAAFVGLSVFLLLYLLTLHQRSLRAFLALIAIAGIIVIAAPTDIWQRIAGLKFATSTETIAIIDPEGSASQRWEIWQTGFRIIADQPLLGVGLGRYEKANHSYNPLLGARDIHNTFLEILAETGIPGLLLFILLIAASLRRASRARRNSNARRHSDDWQRLKLLENGLYAYLAAGVWGTFGYLSLLYIYLAIIYAQTKVVEGLTAEPS